MMRNDLAREVAQCVEVAGSISLGSGLADLLIRGADVEHADERRRYGHRHHEERKLLPKLQAAQKLHVRVFIFTAVDAPTAGQSQCGARPGDGLNFARLHLQARV